MEQTQGGAQGEPLIDQGCCVTNNLGVMHKNKLSGC